MEMALHGSHWCEGGVLLAVAALQGYCKHFVTMMQHMLCVHASPFPVSPA